MTTKETFATAFNCMDGRCQAAVADYVRANSGAQFVDTITEPGIDGILAGKRALPEQPESILPWIKRKAEISSQGHGSSFAVVVGHAHCAGNDVSNEEHASDIAKAVEVVRGWNLFKSVEGIMASPDQNGVWHVSPLKESNAQAA